jgi:hypothetical protein
MCGPSFGVAFVFMGMSAFDQLGRLAAANINNHLTATSDPKRTYRILV